MIERRKVFLDVKGELFRKHGNYLKAHGITIKVLDYDEVTRKFKQKQQMAGQKEAEKTSEKATGKTAQKTVSEPVKTAVDKSPKPPTKSPL